MSKEVSRRELFGRLLGGWRASSLDNPAASDAPSSPRPQPTRLIPVLRPPGAIEEAAFLAGCTRCNACLQACPPHAIVLAPDRFRSAAGTPMIDPTRQPCLLCTGLPCVAACEPGVLSKDLPPAMGRAAVLAHSCLNRMGSFCSVCVERCPVPGALRMEAGLPVVAESACTGCGVCHHVCPAPSNAIVVLAALERPARPAGGER